MRYQQSSYDVPEDKTLRVIIDTDAANEADDQFAIAQALLSPRLDIRAICAAHFGDEKSPHSMEDSYQEILKVVGLLNHKCDVFHMPVLRGAEKALTDDTVALSEGAEAIIAEALREDEHPLYVVSLDADLDRRERLSRGRLGIQPQKRSDSRTRRVLFARSAVAGAAQYVPDDAGIHRGASAAGAAAGRAGALPV